MKYMLDDFNSIKKSTLFSVRSWIIRKVVGSYCVMINVDLTSVDRPTNGRPLKCCNIDSGVVCDNNFNILWGSELSQKLEKSLINIF